MRFLLFILFANVLYAQEFDYSKWQTVVQEKIKEQKIIVIRPVDCRDYLEIKQELEKDEINLETIKIDPRLIRVDGGSGGGGGGPGIQH